MTKQPFINNFINNKNLIKMEKSVKWNIEEMKSMWRQRRNIAKDTAANRKREIETEVRIKKQRIDRELEDKLREIAQEEDSYLQKYYEWSAQRRQELREAYKMQKELKGGEQ